MEQNKPTGPGRARRQAFRIFGTLAAAGLAASCATAPPAPMEIAEFVPLAANPTPAEACANLKQAKYEPEDARFADVTRLDAAHADIRGPIEPVVPDAPGFLRLTVSGGMTNQGPGGPESVVAWRDDGGVWNVSRVYRPSYREPPIPEYPAPPAWPEPPGAVEPTGIVSLEGSGRDAYRGTLAAEQSAALEAMLAAPCLDEEPMNLPLELPLSGGGADHCPHDAIFWSLEIRQGAEARLYHRPCRLLGPVGAIIGLVQSAPLEKEPEKTPTRNGLYQAMADPSAAKLQQFLAGRLPGTTYVSEKLAAPSKVLSYTPVSNCKGTLLLETGDGGTIELTRDWSDLLGYSTWAPDGAAMFSFTDTTDSIRPGGTVAALKFEGAIAWLGQFCPEQESAG